MIPSKEKAPRVNFPDFFGDNVREYLVYLQKVLGDQQVSDIVLNFEKSYWFEIFPLAQLLTILCSKSDPKPKIHVVGPAPHILPYFQGHIFNLEHKVKSGKLSPEESENLELKIKFLKETQPNLRGLAAAFLVGWGAFDLLEQIYTQCLWYKSREARDVPFRDLRDSYIFGYGAGGPSVAHDAYRVWPFMPIYRTAQEDMLMRVNGDELIMGALQKYAEEEIVENGTASNVFFFEPFENVFQHAFPTPHDFDLALMAMRITDWPFMSGKQLRNRAIKWLKKNPLWFQNYFKFINCPFMEIIITDYGVGIPKTIVKPEKEEFQTYCYQRGIPLDQPFWETSKGAWEAIRYAFERTSTSKPGMLPGRRGLSWLKERIRKVNGAINVLSNGGNYVLADFGNGLEEVPYHATMRTAEENRTPIPGTFVRVIFPLKGAKLETLERHPKWGKIFASPTLPLFSQPKPILLLKKISSKLADSVSETEWEALFLEVEASLGPQGPSLCVLDFDHLPLTRISLENLFRVFLKHSVLHGRFLAINCIRHVSCRLDTVEAIDALRSVHLFVPIFDDNLRLYLVGVSPTLENILLRYFHGTLKKFPGEILHFAKHNPDFFLWEKDKPVDFSFRIEEVEAVVRESLGELLEASLEEGKAIGRGRFLLSNSDHIVNTYVEPHQIFSNGKAANFICKHLSVLLRWYYGRLVRSGKKLRVLTATRIGRDIAMRMPEGFDQKTFIYYDYYLIKPEKARLMKHLTGYSIVIVVDIISTGSTVKELIDVCISANAQIEGIVSFIDFSPGDQSNTCIFYSEAGELIEHKTFWRSPQDLHPLVAGEPFTLIDKNTGSISTVREIRETLLPKLAYFYRDEGLRLLEDAQAIHYGHYELFGHHFEFVVNLSRLLTMPSMQLDDILRACEESILKEDGSETSFPTGIVIYPDFSNAHILHAPLERRPQIKKLIVQDKLRFIEARRGYRARGLRYWLSKSEVEELKAWAQRTYPGGFSILLLDDGASSGGTVLALLDLASQLEPQRVAALVLVNRMSHLLAHHQGVIERFEWAVSHFKCLLHLNIPVYSRDNCPLCKERTELAREFRHAKEEWFKNQISRQLNDLELISALNPQDFPEGRLAEILNPKDKLGHPLEEGIPEIPPFSWDKATLLPGPQQTVISRAASIRTAINDGVPIIKILEETSLQPNDDLWRLTALEVARRVDLQQAQRAEKNILDKLISVVANTNIKRRVTALKALRYMRPEALILFIVDILNKTLGGNLNDELSTEFILLMRHVFLYRHLPGIQMEEVHQHFLNELDRVYSLNTPGGSQRSYIEKMNREWGDGPKPRLDLVTVIRELEGILNTLRRPHHNLLYKLGKYLAKYKEDRDEEVLSKISAAVRVTSLTRTLIALLSEINRPTEEELQKESEKIHQIARDLRRFVGAHMERTELWERRVIRKKLDNMVRFFELVELELKLHLVSPEAVLKIALEDFKDKPPTELEGITLGLNYSSSLPSGVAIIIDVSIFEEIIDNLLNNLKHAVDPETFSVQSQFLFRLSSDEPRQVELQLKCLTRNPEAFKEEQDWDMINKLFRDAKPYGVEHSVRDASKHTPPEPWEETWTFWRL